MIPNIDPITAAVLVVCVLLFFRLRGVRANQTRISQLTLARECLDRHAAALEQILDDPTAPAELKKLAIEVSDAMNDRAVVKKFFEWGDARAFEAPADSEGIQAVEAVLAPLRGERPDLVENFSVAVITAVVAAGLRWADGKALSELLFPRLMAAPKRDVAIAATATSLRFNGPFSVRPATPAIA